MSICMIRGMQLSKVSSCLQDLSWKASSVVIRLACSEACRCFDAYTTSREGGSHLCAAVHCNTMRMCELLPMVRADGSAIGFTLPACARTVAGIWQQQTTAICYSSGSASLTER
jgi:hypothetical protein